MTGTPAELDDNRCPQQLVRYLQTNLAGADGPIEIRRCSAGQSNPTYVISTTSGRYVLRRKPSGTLLPSAHAIDREYRVLCALSGGPVPVPRPRLYCADPTVIGTEFYVMDFVEGHVHWNPALPGIDKPLRTRIFDDMNRVLAALRQVDVAGVGLADFGRPGGYLTRQIRRWTDQYRASETERRPDVERLIEWLPANVPADDGQVCLVHGDFRLDNMIFDDAGRVVALLDWELSTLGHPYADLAYQCAQWRLPTGVLRGLAGVDRSALGIPTEREYVATYQARRGLPTDVPGWSFHLVLGLFRMAAICQGIYRRGLGGNASGISAVEYGPRVDTIAREAVEIVFGVGH